MHNTINDNCANIFEKEEMQWRLRKNNCKEKHFMGSKDSPP